MVDKKSQENSSQKKIPPSSTPWLRCIEVIIGPLEEWRGKSQGEILRIVSDGTPEGLKITANVQKTLMGMPSPTTITLFNLSSDTRNAIRANLTKITVKAGYSNAELHTVFQGSILSSLSERTGADIVTKLSAIQGYGSLARGVSSKSFAGGMAIKDVVVNFAKDLAGLVVEGGVIQGVVGKLNAGGWSFAGSTKDALTQLANEFGFSWHIDNGSFKALGDTARYANVTLLNGKNGGLISITPTLTGAFQVKSGVKIKALYVPGVTVGGSVRVQSDISSSLNGEYKVHTCNINIDTYSDTWNMDIDAFSTR